MEHGFSSRSTIKFLASTEFLKSSRTSCLLGQNVQTKIRVSFVKTHLWYRSDFHGHFSFNGTELCMGDRGGGGDGEGGFYKLFFLEVLLFRSLRELKIFLAQFGENWLLWLRNMTSKWHKFRLFWNENICFVHFFVKQQQKIQNSTNSKKCLIIILQCK